MVDLDLAPQSKGKGFFEYLEREGLLNPIARIRFPGEIARRFEMAKYPTAILSRPIEEDTARLQAASELRNELFFAEWEQPNIFGERQHLLDAEKSKHAEFIQKHFNRESFTPWKKHRTVLWLENGKEVFDGNLYTRTYYHYWQIFALASILRSGVNIMYPLDDENIGRALWDFKPIEPQIRKRILITFNLEACHELKKIHEYRAHFEAVAYYKAYQDNTLRSFCDHIDPKTGCMSKRTERTFQRRKREIATHAMKTFRLSAPELIDFVSQQAEWWDTAQRVGPAAIAKEYARNISETIHLYTQITGEDFDSVSALTSYQGGWLKPILRVILPDWVEKQRDLTKCTLEKWADTSLNKLPKPFPISNVDLDEFCAWLEMKGLYQYYWHFQRFTEMAREDSPIFRAAAAAETVAFANLIEMIANAACEERGFQPRGETLGRKLHKLFDSSGPINLRPLLKEKYGHLTRTKGSTLKRRLSQIDRIKRGGPGIPVLRTLLKLLVIRNEGSHLGLNEFNWIAISKMLETMAMASLMIWKARSHTAQP